MRSDWWPRRSGCCVVVVWGRRHPQQFCMHSITVYITMAPTAAPTAIQPYASVNGPNPGVEWYCGSSPAQTDAAWMEASWHSLGKDAKYVSALPVDLVLQLPTVVEARPAHPQTVPQQCDQSTPSKAFSAIAPSKPHTIFPAVRHSHTESRTRRNNLE